MSLYWLGMYDTWEDQTVGYEWLIDKLPSPQQSKMRVRPSSAWITNMSTPWHKYLKLTMYILWYPLSKSWDQNQAPPRSILFGPQASRFLHNASSLVTGESRSQRRMYSKPSFISHQIVSAHKTDSNQTTEANRVSSIKLALPQSTSYARRTSSGQLFTMDSSPTTSASRT